MVSGNTASVALNTSAHVNSIGNGHRIRIVVADDHEMVRAGIISMLQRDPHNEIVGEAGDGRQAVELARKFLPDVIFCDVTMPLLNGIETTRHIREFSRDIKVIMISVHYDQAMVSEALRAGANGYLLKTSAAVELQLALRAAREGATYLSPRVGQVVVDGLLADRDPQRPRVFSALTAKQREVLQLLAEGKTNKEVAACLCISAKTVEAHRGQLMEKLNIHTVAGLTKYAIREGITSVEA
jgi:DNA-binding NarL/FixJ family response regulator